MSATTMTPLQALTEAVYKALDGCLYFGDEPAESPSGSHVDGVVRVLQSVGAQASSLHVRVPHHDPAGADVERHYVWVDGQPMRLAWKGKAVLLADEQAACDETYRLAERQEGPGMGVPEASYEDLPSFDPILLAMACEAAAPDLAAFVLAQNTASSPPQRSAMRL